MFPVVSPSDKHFGFVRPFLVYPIIFERDELDLSRSVLLVRIYRNPLIFVIYGIFNPLMLGGNKKVTYT